MSGKLEGKVAFITGAARGQGRAHAVRLAQEGADIIAIDVAGPLPLVPYESPTEEDLRETARLVKAQDRRIVAERCDVRDLATMRSIVDDGVTQLGRLDIVVANAGICIIAPWDETTPENFQTTIDTNVVGVWNTVMVGAPHLITAGGGSIVLTSSYAGKKLQPFAVGYTASKHAVTGLTRAFAAELGKHRIRVNSIHPGTVMTGMATEDMREAMDRATETNPSLGTMGTPFLPAWATEAEDIAGAVAFLASDDAQFITAEHLSIDAGMQYF